MFPSAETARDFPILYGVLIFVILLFYVGILWIFGRMADNVNKIRKMLEREISSRQQS
ncbi:MAG TPA: hypothetical protein VL633_01240 [Bacteroidota bacterium]|jgi:hypothetical protein|nr:hypothetical protein [Bacteroidota bacterium]